MRGRWGARFVVAVLCCALAVPLLETQAAASISCSYSGDTVTVQITGSDNGAVVLDRATDGTIRVNAAFCPGPEPTYATVHNTDAIRVHDASTGSALALQVDLGRGGFSPGKTLEPTGISEVEIVHTLGAETAPGVLRIQGGESGTPITFGSDAVATNADDDADIDFQQIWLMDVTAYAGIDRISGRGSAATGSPASYQTYLTAQEGNDTILGGDGLNYLGGGAGDDYLVGGARDNDYLYGGPGADSLDGGDGTGDRAYYGTSPAAVSIDLEAGTVQGGDAQGDTLTGIEDLSGSDHADSLLGDANSNYITGGAGPDRLEGGGGNDRLQGDSGDDLELGNDGDDSFEQGQWVNGADDMHGGPGTDSVWYTSRSGPVTASRDNVANDGEPGEGDNVHFDVEIARTREDPGPPPSGSTSPNPSPSGSSTPTPTPSGTAAPTPTPTASSSTSPAPTPTPTPSPSSSPDRCTSGWEMTPAQSPGTYAALNGISAGPDGSGWAVGSRAGRGNNQTLIERWNGRSWVAVRSPNRKGAYNTLHDVDALDWNHGWAVGESTKGSRARTLILRRSASGWSIVRSPNPGRELSVLSAVDALSRSTAWAVGDHWDTKRVYKPLIQRFAGGRWRTVRLAGVEGRLRDVSGTGLRNVWAVGVRDRGGVGRTLIAHHDGSGWDVVPSPNVGDGFNILEGVEALSPTDVWAVGYRRGAGARMKPFALHYNGTRWRVVPVPEPRGSSELYSVAAVSTSNVWAVGVKDSDEPLMLHFDGEAWSEVSAPRPRDDWSQLTDISALSDGTVWAAGHINAGREWRALVERRCSS